MQRCVRRWRWQQVASPAGAGSTAAAGFNVPLQRPASALRANVQLRSRRQTRAPPMRVAVAEPPVAGHDEVLNKTWYDAGGINVEAIHLADGSYAVNVQASHPRPMVLHWAVNDWQLPDQQYWPPNTNQVDDKAVQTWFDHEGRVKLHWPKDATPERVVFVLKETEPENWINNGSCFTVQIKPAQLGDVTSKILDAEGTWSNFTLLNRFNLANEYLEALYAAAPEGPAFLFTWLRLSAQKQLDWARNSAYQSKDIAWVQKVICERVADKARSAQDPWARLFARLAAAGLPRGGGNGDDIRHGILNIMRENGIKEGHRPGLDEPFLEQWHQKLHQNTTQEDVTICEAYLAYLHSGNHDDYWRVLWDNGRITRERLETMHCPIKAWPRHLPHLIGPFQHYLWILKTCHAGADLDTMAECAKGSLDGDTVWQLFDMLQHRHEWWVPGKIVDIRSRVADVWRAPGASRDVLLLDIALDSYFRTCIERTDRSGLQPDDLIEMASLVLRNAALTCESQDIRQCCAAWDRLRGAPDKWSTPWALAALATLQRTELSLAAFGDDLYRLVQPHAEAFQRACKIDDKYIINFGEEVVRGQSVFVLSLLLQDLEPTLRSAAGASAWTVISEAPAAGEVIRCPDLADIQGQRFERPVIVLAQHLGGMEDIPPGVVAVLTESSTDVLSHVAIRARSQRVMLASCADDALWQKLGALEGKHASLSVDASSGDITAKELDPSSLDGHHHHNGDGPAPARLTLLQPQRSQAWALGEASFQSGVVGAKALNLATLRKSLPSWIHVPTSVSLPFGTFERVLENPANAQTAERLRSLQDHMVAPQGGGVPAALAEARSLVSSKLIAPAELIHELETVASMVGMVKRVGEWSHQHGAWADVWAAICQVWASKWTDRAWLSRQACGVREEELSMSVLLQQVVPAQYAFVLHTAHPVTKRRGDVFCELVPGMGETLVGNHPGRALAFAGAPGSDEPQLLSLPSKRTALYAPQGGTLIARSDTNGEDLEQFAGAGLYDSVTVVPLHEVTLDAASEPIYWDDQLRRQVMQEVVKAGHAVEAAMGGSPQDVEGCWVDGRLTVVQARPQVL